MPDYAICTKTDAHAAGDLRAGRSLEVRERCDLAHELEFKDNAELCVRRDRSGHPRANQILQVRARCSPTREVRVGSAQLTTDVVASKKAEFPDGLKLCARESSLYPGEPREGAWLRVRNQCLDGEIEPESRPQICANWTIFSDGSTKLGGRASVRASCRPKRSVSVGMAILEDAPPLLDRRYFSMLVGPSSSVVWLDGRNFQLRIDQPWPAAALFHDRPIRDATEEELGAWVERWTERGFDAVPPIAAISLQAPDGIGAPAWAIAELFAPQITSDGAITFDLTLVETFNEVQSLLPNARFGPTSIFIDEPESLSTTSLFALAASRGKLGRGRRFDLYELTLEDPGEVIGFSQGAGRKVRTQSLDSWVSQWSERGFDQNPPNVGLAFEHPEDPSEIEWGLAELSSPRLSPDGSLHFFARFLWMPNGRMALFTEDGGAAHETTLMAPALFVDSAPQLISSGPTAPCTTDEACASGEICDPVTSYCIREQTCSPTLSCEQLQTCQMDRDVCSWTACDVTRDCQSPEQVCDLGICIWNPSPSIVEDAESASYSGFWGTSQIEDIQKSACRSSEARNLCSPARPCPDGKLCSLGLCYDPCTETSACRIDQTCSDGRCVSGEEALCLTFEKNFALRVGYMAETLSESSGAVFDYYGQSSFKMVNESRPVLEDDPRLFPNAPLREKLLQPFSILGQGWPNFITRVGPLLFGRQSVSPYSAQDWPTGDQAAYSFVDGYFQTLAASQSPDFPDGYIVDSSASGDLNLNRQFGGGGGFGCYIGTVDDSTMRTSPPLLQFGAGFGYGLAETDGLDMGYGGGINTCSATSIQDCDAGSYIGAGGGKNAAHVTGSTQGNYDQSATLGDPTLFTHELLGPPANGLLTANGVYMSCGGGGGFGFQPLVQPSGTSGPDIFRQTYGFGGGGSAFALLKKRSTSEADGQLLPISRTEFVASVNSLASYEADQAARRAPATTRVPTGPCIGSRSERGLLDSSGTLRSSGAGIPQLGVSFSPYGFFISDCGVATSENTYIPGSTSSTEYFFAQFDADRALSQIQSVQINRIAYTLNLNPARLSDYSDPDILDPVSCDEGGTCSAQAINETILNLLEEANSTVSLAIPLFIQHDNKNYTTGAQAIVNDNLEMLDYAVQSLQKFPNIDTLIIGTAMHGAKKGFDVNCNGYTYKQKQNLNLCKGYQSDLTFEDYYYLLQYLFGKLATIQIDRPISVAVRQSAQGWLGTTTIRNAISSGIQPNCAQSGTCTDGQCQNSCAGQTDSAPP